MFPSPFEPRQYADPETAARKLAVLADVVQGPPVRPNCKVGNKPRISTGFEVDANKKGDIELGTAVL